MDNIVSTSLQTLIIIELTYYISKVEYSLTVCHMINFLPPLLINNSKQSENHLVASWKGFTIKSLTENTSLQCVLFYLNRNCHRCKRSKWPFKSWYFIP